MTGHIFAADGDVPTPNDLTTAVADMETAGEASGVMLSGGARAKNIFWQVAGIVNLGTTAHAEGVFLSKTAIKLATGATVNGRLLAQTAVNISGSTVIEPAN